MAKCTKCGAEVLDGAKFCTECGAVMDEPFVAQAAAASINPFEEFENNVPKPEVASELIFGEPDWSKAESADGSAAKPEATAGAAAQPNAKPEATAGAAAKTDAAGDSAFGSWSGQTGYGKPAFDPDAEPVPEVPNFSMPNNSEAQQDAPWGAQQQEAPWGSQQQEAPKGNPDFFNTEWYPGSAQPVGNDKIFAILSYIFLIGWLLAFFIRDSGMLSEYRKQHLNQSLILHIASMIGGIIGGWIGGIIGLATLVLAIMGIVTAAKNSSAPLPGIGTIKIIK